MHLYLYKSTAEKNRLNKLSYLTRYTVLEGTLKSSTSVTSPVIIIENNEFPACNYAYITEFQRYYFIDEVTSVTNNMWQLTMSVDVLMSYKGVSTSGAETGIYALNAYVMRNENATSLELCDITYPARSSADVTTTMAQIVDTSTDAWYGSDSLLASTDNVHQRYIWRVLGQVQNDGGTVLGSITPLNWLIMKGSDARKLGKTIAATGEIGVISGKTIADYSYDMYCLPCPVPNGGSAHMITIPGLIPSGFVLPNDEGETYGVAILNSLKPITTTFRATFDASETLWLNYPPYTTINVQFLPFGQFQLDNSVIFDESNYGQSCSIYIKAVVDPNSGSAALYYGKTSATCIHYLGSANVAIKLPLSSIALNGSRVATSAISAAGNIAAAIATKGAMIGSAASSVVDLATACITPNASVSGGDSTIIDAKPRVTLYHHAIEGTAPALYGKPYCKYVQLSTLTGFTKVSDVHVEGSVFQTATSPEIDMVEQALKAGVIL